METQKLYSDRALIRLCWPLIVEQTLNVLVGMVDVLMVASIGEAAVSGVSLVDTINILLIQVLAALATGGAVVSAQLMGSRKIKEANLAAGQLLIITLTATLAITTISVLGGRGILGLLFGAAEESVMRNAVIYFRLTALSYPFLALYNSAAALFRTVGDSKISMRNSMLMNGINIAGNALCIYGLHMGVEGVAIPTLLSRAFVAVIMLRALCRSKHEIAITSREQFRPNKGLIRRILSIGIPSGLENGMFHFGKVMLSGLVSTLGTVSIAGFAVAGNLVTFLYLPGNALGLGLLTVAGRCVGAGEYGQLRYYTKRFLAANYAILAVVCLVFGFGRHFFAGLYALSPEAETIAAYMLLTHCIAMIIWPPSFLLPNALRAANDVRFTMRMSITVMWVFRVGLAYLFVRVLKMNVYAVWYAMFIDWIVRVIVYPLRFDRLVKKASGGEKL